MTTQPQPAPVRPRMSIAKKTLLGVLITAVVAVFSAIGFIYFIDSKIE